jgi:SAM-dependent methyltransferase
MKPWYEDENFWLRIAPVLFNSGRWSAAPEEMEKAMRLLKLKRGSSVLDACCGVGRHSVELARMGYRVTGVDQVAEFLEAARDTADAEGFEIEFIHADMRSFFHPFEFDAAICMFTSIGYFENLEEDRQVLSNIRMALKPEGRLLVEVIGKEVVARNFRKNEWYEDSDIGLVASEYRIIRNWTRLENRWIVVNAGERGEYTFSHRLFSAAELEALLLSAGFKRVECFGSLAGAPYDENAELLVASAWA